jgi:hypothetical protein
MTKKNENRRNQPEFFFVFNGQPSLPSTTLVALSSDSSPERQSISADVMRVHRDRLIEELREFGC